MSVVAQPLTWDDIKHRPEDAGRRTELVHGELVMSPAPGLEHQIIVKRLVYELERYARTSAWGEVIPGPVDVVLAADLVYEPDLCFVSASRADIMRPTHIEGPPDLCVEVTSESNRTYDTVVKYGHYARHGVAEYWLFDTREREVSTWRNQGGSFSLIGRARPGQLIASLVLPGLQLDADSIFPKASG